MPNPHPENHSQSERNSLLSQLSASSARKAQQLTGSRILRCHKGTPVGSEVCLSGFGFQNIPTRTDRKSRGIMFTS